MISEIEKQSLYDAMNTLMVSELPEPLSGEEKEIWVKGLAKVKKNDNSTNWTIVRNDGYGNPFIVQDFGRCAMIVKIFEVHPTNWLRGMDMPVIKSKTDMVNYLSNHGEDESKIKSILNEKGKSKDEIETSRKDIMAMIINYAESDIEKRHEEERRQEQIYEERIKQSEKGIEK